MRQQWTKRRRAGVSSVKPSASPKPHGPHPSKPHRAHPCNMPQAKTEAALQFSECCAAEVALQHWLFCNADVILTKSCTAASEKLQCNTENAALRESGAFLQLSCGFQAPTSGHPCPGRAETSPGRQQSADKKFVQARDPENWKPEVFDQTSCSKNLLVEFALNNRELVKAEVIKKRVFEQMTPLK